MTDLRGPPGVGAEGRRFARRPASWPFALLTAVGLALLLPSQAGAQEWRTLSQSRQLAGEEAFQVAVRYAAGDFRMGPASEGTLYRVAFEYDEESFEPITDYATGELTVGVRRPNERSRSVRGDRTGEMDLRLARSLPTDLRLELGAVRADIDLADIALRDLRLSTGASDSRLRVSTPNAERVGLARLEVGAARFEALELGNLNARRLEVDAGVGDVTLDLGGEWRNDLELEVSMGLGSLEVRVPPEVGVQLRRQTIVMPLDAPDLSERDGVMESDNWDSAEHRLRISVNAAFGRLRVVRPD